MAEYIDREAMLEQIARREPLMVGNKMISIDARRVFIMNRPIADVEEAKHGHWVFDTRTIVPRCSVCGERYCRDSFTILPVVWRKMRGGG